MHRLGCVVRFKGILLTILLTVFIIAGSLGTAVAQSAGSEINCVALRDDCIQQYGTSMFCFYPWRNCLKDKCRAIDGKPSRDPECLRYCTAKATNITEEEDGTRLETEDYCYVKNFGESTCKLEIDGVCFNVPVDPDPGPEPGDGTIGGNEEKTSSLADAYGGDKALPPVAKDPLGQMADYFREKNKGGAEDAFKRSGTRMDTYSQSLECTAGGGCTSVGDGVVTQDADGLPTGFNTFNTTISTKGEVARYSNPPQLGDTTLPSDFLPTPNPSKPILGPAPLPSSPAYNQQNPDPDSYVLPNNSSDLTPQYPSPDTFFSPSIPTRVPTVAPPLSPGGQLAQDFGNDMRAIGNSTQAFFDWIISWF